jgi:hypothetical protein
VWVFEEKIHARIKTFRIDARAIQHFFGRLCSVWQNFFETHLLRKHFTLERNQFQEGSPDKAKDETKSGAAVFFSAEKS